MISKTLLGKWYNNNINNLFWKKEKETVISSIFVKNFQNKKLMFAMCMRGDSLERLLTEVVIRISRQKEVMRHL